MGSGEDGTIKAGRDIQSFKESRVWMSRDSFWGRQVWLYPVPWTMGFKVWNLVKLNQESIKQCIRILYPLPCYLGLIRESWQGLFHWHCRFICRCQVGRQEGKYLGCRRVRNASVCFCTCCAYIYKDLSFFSVFATNSACPFNGWASCHSTHTSKITIPGTDKSYKASLTHTPEVWELLVVVHVHPLP